MRSDAAKKRAARNFYLRNKDNPEFKAKRSVWQKKFRAGRPEAYEASSYKFNNLKSKCKHRSIALNLSLQDYERLTSATLCYYCHGRLPRLGSGLDRIDSDGPYSVDNCVPCCYICNVMKSDLTVYEFLHHINKIIKTVPYGANF
jgi:hypothetical protein